MFLQAKRLIHQKAENISNPALRALLLKSYAWYKNSRVREAIVGPAYDPRDDGERELLRAFRSKNPYAVLDALPEVTEAVEDVLVFMPTYAPDKTEIGQAPRPLSPLGPTQLRERCLAETLGSPWIYLDAIDSIKHVLGANVRLVVADFRSSEEVRNVLLDHQRKAGMPNYELWFADEKDSQWKAFNLVLADKLGKKPALKYVVYTSSDIIWWQKSFLSECWLEFRKDFDAQILYPTVVRAENDVPHQQASLPRDKDAFAFDLCNAYIAVYRADFFRAFDGKYPDIFRNCFTESFLPMMLRALGAKQKIVPRANCWHNKNADMWNDPAQGTYAYLKEHPVFTATWEKLRAHKAAHPWDVSVIPFLKNLLFKNKEYYENTEYSIYREGREISRHKGFRK